MSQLCRPLEPQVCARPLAFEDERGQDGWEGMDRVFPLEDDDHLVQLPDLFRADGKLKPVIKGIIQMLLEH